MSYKKLIFLVSFLVGCSKSTFTQPSDFSAQEQQAKVIYGQDGRSDIYEVSDEALKKLADSTVALIKTNQLLVQGSTTVIQGKNYGQSMQLCSSERFREQSAGAFCSGSLVAEDTIITAGHCITSQSDCVGTSFVFGYAVKTSGVLPQQVLSNEVYRCREIIKQVLVNNGADYAVIKLDRAVTNHLSLKVRQTGQPQVGDSLVVIGHPAGLPTKITQGGVIRSTTSSDFFVAGVDTYGGNSGSAVFNARTKEIEGILVRGEQDFEYQNGCYVSKVCSEGTCRGEDVTRISVVKPYLPPSTAPTPNPTPTPAPPPIASAPVVAKPEVFSSSQVVAIPDNNSQGVSSLIMKVSAIQKRKVLVNVKIKHTYIGDLTVQLVTPENKVITLHAQAGGSSDNIEKTYDVTSLISTSTPAGAYRLFVKDTARADIGSVLGWSLSLEP